MLACRRCGKGLGNGTPYCPYCGTSLARPGNTRRRNAVVFVVVAGVALVIARGYREERVATVAFAPPVATTGEAIGEGGLAFITKGTMLCTDEAVLQNFWRGYGADLAAGDDVGKGADLGTALTSGCVITPADSAGIVVDPDGTAGLDAQIKLDQNGVAYWVRSASVKPSV